MLIPSNVNYSLFPIPYSLIYSYSLNIINLNHVDQMTIKCG